MVWDSGRADAVDREKMSRLIWGRLDSGLGSALVSLVEAVTLVRRDDLARSAPGSRSTRTAPDQAERFRGLRAGLVRCEDLAGTDTAAAERVAALRTREQKLVTQAARGADVTGPLGELETDAARAERDLIVHVSQRRTLEKGRADAPGDARRARDARDPTLHELADRCRREIATPPKLAVPDVSRLGRGPGHAPGARRVRRPARSRRPRVRGRRRRLQRAPARAGRAALQADRRARAAADANGRSASPTVRSGYDEAHAAVTATPCDVTLARYLVEQYLYLTRDLPTAAARRDRDDRHPLHRARVRRRLRGRLVQRLRLAAARRRLARVRDHPARHGRRRQATLGTAPAGPTTGRGAGCRRAQAGSTRTGRTLVDAARDGRARLRAHGGDRLDGRPAASARPRPACAARGSAPA